MEGNATLITVLCTLLGFAGGVCTALFGILKKINRTDISVAKHTEQIRTLFDNDRRTEQSYEKIIELVKTTVNQNTLLIQRFTAES